MVSSTKITNRSNRPTAMIFHYWEAIWHPKLKMSGWTAGHLLKVRCIITRYRYSSYDFRIKSQDPNCRWFMIQFEKLVSLVWPFISKTRWAVVECFKNVISGWVVDIVLKKLLTIFIINRSYERIKFKSPDITILIFWVFNFLFFPTKRRFYASISHI